MWRLHASIELCAVDTSAPSVAVDFLTSSTPVVVIIIIFIFIWSWFNRDSGNFSFRIMDLRSVAAIK